MNAGAPTHPLNALLTHAAWLRRLAGALLRDRDDAEDVVQSTLVAAWQHPPHQQRDVRPWLAEVARNQAEDQRRAERRRQSRQQAVAALDDDRAPSPEQLVGDLQIHREVAEIVSALDEPYRQAVLLRYYEGLSAADVARQLNVPAGTLRWRLKEGLDRVRVQLDARNNGDRRRWMAALAPLADLPRPEGAPAAPPSSSATGAPRGGVGQLPLGPVVIVVAAAAAVAAAGLLLVQLRSDDPRTATGALASRTDRASSPPGPGAAAPKPVPRFTPAPAAIRPVAAPVRPDDPESLMRRLLTSAAANDYDGFLEYGDDRFQAATSPAQLREISMKLQPLLEAGFTAEPLGPLRKEGLQVHLWKISAPTHEEDRLVRLTVANGKVAGFLVQ